MSVKVYDTTNYRSPMRIAAIVGLVGAVAAVIGLFVSGADSFFQAYLYSYLFWLGISLGMLVLLMLHFAVSARWGLTIRRIAEAASGVIVVMAVLFIPLLFGLSSLYPWARPAEVAASALLQAKSFYLNVPFYIIRAVIYFAIWIALAFVAMRRVAKISSDPAGDPTLRGRLQGFGAAGLILYALTITLASVDWLMSLQPEWVSTAFGVVVGLAQVQSGIAFAVLMINLLPGLSLGRRWDYESTPVPFQDLGALMMTLVMGVAYVFYFQFLIQWAGNIPREVIWWVQRTEGGWLVLSLFFSLFQFVIPFIILLTVRARHNLRILAWLGGLLLFSNLVTMFWHVKPAFFPGQFALSWLDIVMPIAIGGLWVASFFYLLQRRPPLPVSDQVVIKLKEEQHASHVPNRASKGSAARR